MILVLYLAFLFTRGWELGRPPVLPEPLDCPSNYCCTPEEWDRFEVSCQPSADGGDMTDFTLLPPGTVVYAPNAIHEVVFQFTNAEDAIVFHEFIRDFVNGKLTLHVGEPNGASDDS